MSPLAPSIEHASEVLVTPKLPLDALDLLAADPQPNPYAVKDEVWLAKAARRRVVRTTALQLELCAILAAYSDQVSAAPNHRELFEEFCHQIGLNYNTGTLRVRVYKFLPVAFWERYQELDWGVVLEAVSRTHRRGETPEERRARVLEACEEALTHLYSTAGVRRMLEATRRAEREAEEQRTAHLLSEVGRDSAGDAGYEICQPETSAEQHTKTAGVTDRYAAGEFDAPGRECLVGDRPLSPQEAGGRVYGTAVPPAEFTAKLFGEPDGAISFGACRQRLAQLEAEGYVVVWRGGAQ